MFKGENLSQDNQFPKPAGIGNAQTSYETVFTSHETSPARLTRENNGLKRAFQAIAKLIQNQQRQTDGEALRIFIDINLSMPQQIVFGSNIGQADTTGRDHY